MEEVPTKMSEFKTMGAKDGSYKGYQKINYCEKLIAGLEQEAVDSHNSTFGRIFKWLDSAIKARKGDIVSRKAQSKKAREHREKCLEQA